MKLKPQTNKVKRLFENEKKIYQVHVCFNYAHSTPTVLKAKWIGYDGNNSYKNCIQSKQTTDFKIKILREVSLKTCIETGFIKIMCKFCKVRIRNNLDYKKLYSYVSFHKIFFLKNYSNSNCKCSCLTSISFVFIRVYM